MRRGREVFTDPTRFDWDSRDLLRDLDEDPDRHRPILDLVEAMEEPTRSVVEMVGFAQLGKVETARRLGLSRQWVQKLWRQGREDLIRALQEETS